MSARFALIASTLLLAVAALSTAGGCNSDKTESTDESVTELTEPANALSEELMVTLAQAKNFHHKADVHLKDAQLDSAVTSVEQILSIPFPKGAPEGQDVILDARARLAKLLVTSGKLEAAMKVTDEGIAAGSRESFFRANLHTVRGHVWQAMAQRADEVGDVASGKSARRSAVVEFDHSIQINRAVLARISGKPNQ